MSERWTHLKCQDSGGRRVEINCEDAIRVVLRGPFLARPEDDERLLEVEFSEHGIEIWMGGRWWSRDFLIDAAREKEAKACADL